MARLKEIREALRLKQAELAEKIGKSQTTISDIEKEKYPIDKTISLAIQAAFGVNSEWLLDGKEPKLKDQQLFITWMKERCKTGDSDLIIDRWLKCRYKHTNFPIPNPPCQTEKDRSYMGIMGTKERWSDRSLKLIRQWLDAFEANADPDECIWLKVEMKAKIPKFAEWLKKCEEHPQDTEEAERLKKFDKLLEDCEKAACPKKSEEHPQDTERAE